MVGVLVALVLAVYLLVVPQEAVVTPFYSGLLVAAILTFGAILTLLQGLSWWALQRAELKATPRTLELYWQRRGLTIVALCLTTLALLAIPFLPMLWLLALWLITLGALADAIYHTLGRVFLHLTPSAMIGLYSTAAKKCIQQDKPAELTTWIDTFTEAALQALENKRPAFTLQVSEELTALHKNFLQASKSISHHSTDPTHQASGDTVVYIVLYLLQRLELINRRSAELGLTFVNAGLLTALGKMTVDGAGYDISIAQYPLLYLGRATQQIANAPMPELISKASYTLVELSRQITQKVDLTYLEINDFFSSVVAQLEENAQNLFRNNKAISASVLQQPFLDLKALFTQEPLAQHRDSAAIQTTIDTALGQFQALAEVMQEIPPITLNNPEPLPDDEGLSAKIVQDLEERLGLRTAPEEEPPAIPPEADK